MIGLKQKIIAAMFAFVTSKYETLGMDSQICNEVDRINLTTESIIVGAENNVCDEDVLIDGKIINNIPPSPERSCWKEDSEKLAWTLYTLASFESGFKKHIHEGKCKWDECDPVWKILPDGKKQFVRHKARTLWQMHKTSFMTKDEWNEMVGTSFEATSLAATIAGKELSYFKEICGTDKGALSIYATGKTCKWKEGLMRANKINQNIKEYSDEDLVIKLLEQYEQCKIKPEYNNNYPLMYAKQESLEVLPIFY